MTSRVDILAAHGSDAARWRAVVSALPPERQDLHQLPEYAAIFEAAPDCGMQARAALLETEAGAVLYPFMLRDVTIGGRPAEACGRPARDMAAPYGIGGPVCTASDPTAAAELHARFDHAFRAWAQDEALASEFLCPHVYTGSLELVSAHGGYQHQAVKPVVVVDLAEGPEGLRRQLNRGHAAAINKARRGGVAVELVDAPTDEQYKLFNSLYRATMDRHGAQRRWYFDDDFFRRTRRLLAQERCAFFVARAGGAVAAWHVILRHGPTAYYHFSGSDTAFSALRPTTLLMHEVSLWAQAQGCTRLYLGGGPTSAPDDGVFRFKAGFSKHTATLHNAWRVLRQDTYDELNRQRADCAAAGPGNPDYFPFYRS